MKRFLVILFCLLLPIYAFAETVEIDTDSNGDVDISYGGTNASTAAGARTNLGVQSTLTDSAGLAGALDDETGFSAGALAMFNISPTIVTGFNIGSADINETELEAIDGIEASTAELNYNDGLTGTTGTGNQVRSASPTVTGTAIFDVITYNSMTGAAVAAPQIILRDTGCLGSVKEISKISANAEDGTDGAEFGSISIQTMRNGSEAVVVYGNADTQELLVGDTNFQPRIVHKTYTATDGDFSGDVRFYTVDSGATSVFGQALHVDTDGELIVADGDVASAGAMPAIGLAVEAGTGSKRVLVSGGICETDWNWTVGGIVYVSDDPTTTEGLTQTAISTSGDQVQVVGIAVSADCIEVNMGGYVLVEVP